MPTRIPIPISAPGILAVQESTGSASKSSSDTHTMKQLPEKISNYRPAIIQNNWTCVAAIIIAITYGCKT
jgi:hypothetical protein